MNTLHSINTVKPLKQQNYRLKICVNITFNDNYIDHYIDTITDIYLLKKINKFLSFIKKIDNDMHINIKYCYFQKSNVSNEYGIIMAIANSIINIIQYFDENLTVFGYFLLTDISKIIYLTENTRLKNTYYGFDWHVSINSFIQVHPEISNIVHDTVKEWIIKDTKYIGLGGEMSVYQKMLNDNNNNNNDICITNSQEIYDDSILNNEKQKVYLVNYDKLIISDYITNTNEYILLINISRNGLKELAKQISELIFRQIIYIGCNHKAINRDITILKKSYKITNIKKILQDDNNYIYVIELIMK